MDKVLLAIALTLAFFLLAGITIAVEKKNHPNGAKYRMANGIEGTQIEYRFLSRDINSPTIHLQWTVNGVTYDAWFRNNEVTRIDP